MRKINNRPTRGSFRLELSLVYLYSLPLLSNTPSHKHPLTITSILYYISITQLDGMPLKHFNLTRTWGSRYDALPISPPASLETTQDVHQPSSQEVNASNNAHVQDDDDKRPNASIFVGRYAYPIPSPAGIAFHHSSPWKSSLRC
jgi:hypothetical protein